MARAVLRVPSSQVPALARLVGLNAEEHRSLLAALTAAPASASLASLAMCVAGATDLDGDDVDAITRLLAMLYTLRDRGRTPRDEFLSDVELAAKETGESSLISPSVDWGDARKRIGDLLDVQPLALTAKSFDVLSEHERMFCDARILTDIRPVFAVDVDHEPDALVLVHELRLSYHQAGEMKAVYIAMDSGDLRELYEVLERAFKKERSIEGLAAKSGVQVLKPQSHPE